MEERFNSYFLCKESESLEFLGDSGKYKPQLLLLLIHYLRGQVTLFSSSEPVTLV